MRRSAVLVLRLLVVTMMARVGRPPEVPSALAVGRPKGLKARRTIIAGLWLVSLVPALSGCVSHKYPLEWAPRQPRLANRECPDLAGSYEADGRAGRPNANSLHLGSLLLASPGAVRIDIRLLDTQTAEWSAWSDGTLLNARRFVIKKDFRCKEGQFVVGLPGESVAQEGVFGKFWRTANLSKATDGALIARVSERFIGMAYFIPVADRESSWYRFSPSAYRSSSEGF